MTALLEIREYLKNFYSRFDVYIVPVLKFALAVFTLILINRNLGFMHRINSTPIVLIVGLICSFMPLNLLIVFAAMFILLHVYALSLECAVVVLALFMLMFLLYFRFSPSDSLAVLLTPVFFVLHIPYAIPLAFGLVGSPLSAVSVGCGVVVFYVIDYIMGNSSVLANLEAESTVAKFKYIIDNLLNNKTMVAMVMAFAVTVLIVYLIRKLSIDHSWTIAMIVGAVSDIVIILVGDMVLGMEVSVPSLVVGSIVSLLLMIVLQFFVFSVDYSRTEQLQFEDDEYYYYVKAVPKMAVAVSEKKVKRIKPKASPVRNTAVRTASARSEVKPRPVTRPKSTAKPSAPRMPKPEQEGWRKVSTDTQKLDQ